METRRYASSRDAGQRQASMGDRYGPLTAVDLVCLPGQPLGGDQSAGEIRFRSLQIAGEICARGKCRQAAAGLSHLITCGRDGGTELSERDRERTIRNGEGRHNRLQ
jgi:hypothetical protein